MRKAAFLLAFATAGCASSPWQSIESVPGGKLYVPKLYAPLLPGSIYPDRKAPVPAKGRPALVVVCPEKGSCPKDAILDQAAQRGFVALVTSVAEAAIAPRTEVDLARTGTVIVTPTSLKVEVHPPPEAGASPSSPSKKALLAALLESAPRVAPDGVVLKLYSPNSKGLLPAEAFRDAVEWLAGVLAPP